MLGNGPPRKLHFNFWNFQKLRKKKKVMSPPKLMPLYYRRCVLKRALFRRQFSTTRFAPLNVVECSRGRSSQPTRNMAFFRPISLALVALLAAAIPDAAQAFAPSSLRAVGAAKAQLPAVPAPRRALFEHAPLRRRSVAGRVCAGQAAWRDLAAAGVGLMGAAGPGMNVLCPRRRNAAWRPCASMAHASSPEEACNCGWFVARSSSGRQWRSVDVEEGFRGSVTAVTCGSRRGTIG